MKLCVHIRNNQWFFPFQHFFLKKSRIAHKLSSTRFHILVPIRIFDTLLSRKLKNKNLFPERMRQSRRIQKKTQIDHEGMVILIQRWVCVLCGQSRLSVQLVRVFSLKRSAVKCAAWPGRSRRSFWVFLDWRCPISFAPTPVRAGRKMLVKIGPF